MKYIEKDFNVHSFESFVFSVLRQMAAKSKQELLIQTGYSNTDNYSNNKIQFDAYAPAGFYEVNTPAVFEIKYAGEYYYESTVSKIIKANEADFKTKE